MGKWDLDDKDVAMIGIVILGITGAIIVATDATAIITAGIASLGALASGRKPKENNDGSGHHDAKLSEEQ